MSLKPADVVILQRRGGLVLEFPGSAQAGWGDWEHGKLDEFCFDCLLVPFDGSDRYRGGGCLCGRRESMEKDRYPTVPSVAAF